MELTTQGTRILWSSSAVSPGIHCVVVLSVILVACITYMFVVGWTVSASMGYQGICAKDLNPPSPKGAPGMGIMADSCSFASHAWQILF